MRPKLPKSEQTIQNSPWGQQMQQWNPPKQKNKKLTSLMLNTQNQGHVNQLLLWQGHSFRLWDTVNPPPPPRGITWHRQQHKTPSIWPDAARKIVSEASLPAALTPAQPSLVCRSPRQPVCENWHTSSKWRGGKIWSLVHRSLVTPSHFLQAAAEGPGRPDTTTPFPWWVNFLPASKV